MRASHFVSKLSAVLRAFRRAERGNVAIMLGLSIVPVVGITGAAVDYSRTNSVKAEMQTALDSTALMLAKEAAVVGQAQVNTNAQKYFSAVFNRPDVTNVAANAVYTPGGTSQLVVNASAQVPTAFVKMFGYDSLTVNGTATAKWGNSRLRVALALDNTGSMSSDGKMDALKTATNTLLTQLQAIAETSGDVYVSIVPFSKDVNLDPANYQANWIDWTEWDTKNGTCSKSGYSSKSRCESHTGVWTPADHSTWNGCVMDRGNSSGPATGAYDTNVVAPDPANTATMFAAEQFSSCAEAALPLSDNWTQMGTLVSNMSPGGNTNQAIGLALGWMSLTGGGPFTAPAMDPTYTYSQVIVLLSDGLNTEDRWYTSQSSIDARQKLTCANVKAAGVLVYTVQVNTGKDPTSTLLRDCASDKNKFFELKSADEMVTTFNTISTELGKLFVAN
ncbi:MAG TPA: pilus assembly protein [Pseudolabrys sp.]|jgi:Flp pilus assembly protein TadG|nr:pilus assembly protein [Pseudolabrys sp.]